MMFNKYKPKFVRNEDGTMKVSGKCVFTGDHYETQSFPEAAAVRYREGEYLQNAFSMLSAEDREFILSGISPAGWKSEFSDEEDC